MTLLAENSGAFHVWAMTEAVPSTGFCHRLTANLSLQANAEQMTLGAKYQLNYQWGQQYEQKECEAGFLSTLRMVVGVSDGNDNKACSK